MSFVTVGSYSAVIIEAFDFPKILIPDIVVMLDLTSFGFLFPLRSVLFSLYYFVGLNCEITLGPVFFKLTNTKQ